MRTSESWSLKRFEKTGKMSSVVFCLPIIGAIVSKVLAKAAIFAGFSKKIMWFLLKFEEIDIIFIYF